MRKLTKPALNSQATLNRQGKHAKGTPMEITGTVDITQKPAITADMSMKKDELLKMAQDARLDTKGTKADLVARINA